MLCTCMDIIMHEGIVVRAIIIIMAVVTGTVCWLIRLVISLECFIEITPDFLCHFMND